jgi:acyl-CoA thioester hydrolase
VTRKFSTEVLVQWADVDLAGVVYFAHFFRFFSIAEAAFYRSMGPTMVEMEESLNIRLPRVDAHCRYIKPAYFGDHLQVELSIDHVYNKAIKYLFDVTREQDLVAEGHLVIVCVSRSDFKAIPLPTRLREMLEPYAPSKNMSEEKF